MKKIILIVLWISSLALAFNFGKYFDNQSTKIEVQVKEKIIYKESVKKAKVSEVTQSVKPKIVKKKKSTKDYYQRRYDFLTNKDSREESIIDCRSNKDKCWKIQQYYKMTGQRKKLLVQVRNGCSGDDVDSCFRLYDLENNKQKKKNIKLMLKNKCAKNNAKACVGLGEILEYSNTIIDKEGFNLREKGCELDVKTCSSLAHSLNSIKDNRAGDFFIKACEAGGDYSCMSAANYYYEKGVSDKAGEMLRMGCDQNQSYECRSYYEFLLANKRLEEANTIKSQSCENEKVKGQFYCK